MPKERKYTFRKGEFIPYESGSPMHEEVKRMREIGRALSEPPTTRRRRDSLF